jgi:hypothetical protein
LDLRGAAGDDRNSALKTTWRNPYLRHPAGKSRSISLARTGRTSGSIAVRGAESVTSSRLIGAYVARARTQADHPDILPERRP